MLVDQSTNLLFVVSLETYSIHIILSQPVQVDLTRTGKSNNYIYADYMMHYKVIMNLFAVDRTKISR